MSSAMISAHGGSRSFLSQKGESTALSGIIHNTMVNSPKDVKEKHLDRLIAQTTGTPREKPIMDGVLTSTVPDGRKAVPELHKVSSKEVGKTKSKRFGQIPYEGPKY